MGLCGSTKAGRGGPPIANAFLRKQQAQARVARLGDVAAGITLIAPGMGATFSLASAPPRGNVCAHAAAAGGALDAARTCLCDAFKKSAGEIKAALAGDVVKGFDYSRAFVPVLHVARKSAGGSAKAAELVAAALVVEHQPPPPPSAQKPPAAGDDFDGCVGAPTVTVKPLYEVIWLSTVPGQRGRGCGTVLFYAILDLCAAAGGEAVVVTSTLQACCWWLGVGKGEEAGKKAKPQLRRSPSGRHKPSPTRGGKRSPGSPSKKKVAHASPTGSACGSAGSPTTSGTPASKKRWQRCPFAMLPVVVQRGKGPADVRRKLKAPVHQQRFDRLVSSRGGVTFSEEEPHEVARAVGTPLPVTRFSPVQTSHIWWLRK